MKGRKGIYPKALDEHNFAQLAKSELHARTRQRLLGLSHLQDGVTITDAAKFCKVSRSTVHSWLKRLKCEGLDGLQEKEGRGPHPKLSSEQHEAFKQSVLELQSNREGGRIRGQDVLQLMEKKFNISCDLSTVYRTLARVDLVWISGRSVHPKADVKAQEDFKKTSKIT